MGAAASKDAANGKTEDTLKPRVSIGTPNADSVKQWQRDSVASQKPVTDSASTQTQKAEVAPNATTPGSSKVGTDPVANTIAETSTSKPTFSDPVSKADTTSEITALGQSKVDHEPVSKSTTVPSKPTVSNPVLSNPSAKADTTSEIATPGPSKVNYEPVAESKTLPSKPKVSEPVTKPKSSPASSSSSGLQPRVSIGTPHPDSIKRWQQESNQNVPNTSSVNASNTLSKAEPRSSRPTEIREVSKGVPSSSSNQADIVERKTEPSASKAKNEISAADAKPAPTGLSAFPSLKRTKSVHTWINSHCRSSLVTIWKGRVWGYDTNLNGKDNNTNIPHPAWLQCWKMKEKTTAEGFQDFATRKLKPSILSVSLLFRRLPNISIAWWSFSSYLWCLSKCALNNASQTWSLHRQTLQARWPWLYTEKFFQPTVR